MFGRNLFNIRGGHQSDTRDIGSSNVLTLRWRAMQLHIIRVWWKLRFDCIFLYTIQLYTASEPGTGKMLHGTRCGTWYMVCRVVHVTGEMVVGGPGVAWQPLNLRPHCLAQGHQKPHRHPQILDTGTHQNRPVNLGHQIVGTS